MNVALLQDGVAGGLGLIALALAWRAVRKPRKAQRDAMAKAAASATTSATRAASADAPTTQADPSLTTRIRIAAHEGARAGAAANTTELEQLRLESEQLRREKDALGQLAEAQRTELGKARGLLEAIVPHYRAAVAALDAHLDVIEDHLHLAEAPRASEEPTPAPEPAAPTASMCEAPAAEASTSEGAPSEGAPTDADAPVDSSVSVP